MAAAAEAPLLGLPEECVLAIMGRLDVRDMLALACACAGASRVRRMQDATMAMGPGRRVGLAYNASLRGTVSSRHGGALARPADVAQARAGEVGRLRAPAAARGRAELEGLLRQAPQPDVPAVGGRRMG